LALDHEKVDFESASHANHFNNRPSIAPTSDDENFKSGDRVFHQTFGSGVISGIDGNKLSIEFDKAGQRRVVDSFVEKA
jgi:GH25 family lysozyme M1 (1,4-beta-N-acetylmuramidase)